MNRAVRILVVVPALAGLGWLSVHAVETGIAGSRAFEASVAMRSWSASRTPQPTEEAVAAIRESLLQAQATTPEDPALHELLGLIDVRTGQLPQAAIHFANAIRLRPTSPQSWGDLAAVLYRLGDTGPVFRAAIARAAELGKFEPDVQAIVANYGLAVWNEVGPETRAPVEATITAAMKRNPLEMLQIAQRRGRLELACRHLAGAPRQIEPKWNQLCESMEATP